MKIGKETQKVENGVVLVVRATHGHWK